MLQHIINGSTLFVRRGKHPQKFHPPQPRRVCADCFRSAKAERPLYPMNGQRYCAECLQIWCASLPAVQADRLAWARKEQES